MRLIAAVPSLLLAGLVLTGCVAASPSESAPPSATEPPLASVSITPSASTPKSTSTATPEPIETGIVPFPSTGPVKLGLSDAMRSEGGWEEHSFRVPGQNDRMTAMGASISCGTAEVEYRFTNQTGKVTFDVAQSLDSKSSSIVLEFTLTANGKTIETKQIAFDETAQLAVDLTGRSAVILSAKQASRCSDSTTALITSVVVQGS